MRCKNHVIQIVYVIVFSIFINCCIINDSIVFANDDNQNSEAVRDISATRSTSSELVQYLSTPETYDLGLGFIGAGLVGKTIFGITVTSGMVIGATGILFAASLACTSYSIYNFIKTTRPKEEPDGSVIYHMGLEEYIGESIFTQIDGVGLDKTTSYLDVSNVTPGDYVCLTTLPLNVGGDRDPVYASSYYYPTFVFADLIYYDEISTSFRNFYTQSANDIVFTLGNSYLKGSILSSLSSPVGIARFMINDNIVSHATKINVVTKSTGEFKVIYRTRSKPTYSDLSAMLQHTFMSGTGGDTSYAESYVNDPYIDVWIKVNSDMVARGLVGLNLYRTTKNTGLDQIVVPDDKFKINEDIKVIPPAPEVFTDPTYKIEDMPIENVKVPFPEIPPDLVIKPVPETDPNPDPNPEPNPDPSTPWEWVIKWMTDFWEKLKQLLIDVLKFVFVPDTWEEFVKDLDDTLKDKMPFIDQINDLKDTIHFSGDERLIIPFIRGTYITLPDYFENNRIVFRNMLSAIMHVLFLVGLIKRFIPRFVVTDAGK